MLSNCAAKTLAAVVSIVCTLVHPQQLVKRQILVLSYVIFSPKSK